VNRPEIEAGDPVFFVDSIGKKVRAIQEFCGELKLNQTYFEHARGEDLLRSGRLDAVRTVVMRAVAPAEHAAQWIDPKIPQWVFLLGPRQLEEWRTQEAVLSAKKMKITETKSFSLPHNFGDRYLLKISRCST
jgi:16S rRNA G527 N7-methylase RsmG